MIEVAIVSMEQALVADGETIRTAARRSSEPLELADRRPSATRSTSRARRPEPTTTDGSHRRAASCDLDDRASARRMIDDSWSSTTTPSRPSCRARRPRPTPTRCADSAASWPASSRSCRAFRRARGDPRRARRRARDARRRDRRRDARDGPRGGRPPRGRRDAACSTSSRCCSCRATRTTTAT